MTRPFYESDSDRKKELAVISKIGGLARKTPIKLPIRYAIDFAMFDGKQITSWVEVKCRKNSQAAYPTLMISAAKLIEGLNLARHSGKPFYLVVEWTDRIGFLEIKALTDFAIGYGGRVDRADAQDMEPVVFIPTDQFKTIFATKE